MLTNVCQRWNNGRAAYRPAGEEGPLNILEVAELKEHSVAKAFIERHHYSGSFPAARSCFGLYENKRPGGGELVGVLVFSVPCSSKVLSNVFGSAGDDSAELGRLVLLDRIPANAETFFLSRTFRAVKGRYAGILSFSDPMLRRTAAGAEVFKGHIGIIYQAANARFLGRSTARSLHLLPSGEVLSDRTLQKIRNKERGWKYSAGVLEKYGASELRAEEDSRAWLKHWLAQLTRVVRHPGNYRYAWSLDRALKLPTGLAFPKVKL